MKYEIDGVIYEPIVSSSYIMEFLKAGGVPAMVMYGQIQQMRDKKIAELSSEMPAGLSEKSYLSRISIEQRADAEAMHDFIKEKYPVQYKRLFKGDQFVDFMTAATICAFDEFYDIEVEKGSDSVLSLSAYTETVNRLKQNKLKKKRK